MIEQYQDTEGTIVTAQQLTGPTLLNTIHGETCGSESDWIVTLPDGRIALFTNAAFTQSFNPTT